MNSKTYTWRDGLSGRCPINMTMAAAKGAAHQGECLAEIEHLAHHLRDQLRAIPTEDKIDVLQETGAWEARELANGNSPLPHLQSITMNDCLLLWIAVNDIKENPADYEDCED